MSLTPLSPNNSMMQPPKSRREMKSWEERRPIILFNAGRFVSLAALVFWAWPLLFICSWYIENIPNRKLDLPYAKWLRTNQDTFYKWLSEFVKGWLLSSVVWTVLLYGTLALSSVIDVLFLHYFVLVYSNPIMVVVCLYLAFIFATGYLGFYSAKSTHWDVLFWQAELAAKLLVGGSEEYDKLNEDEKRKVKRHIVDVSIGINKGTWIVSEGKVKIINSPADSLAKFGGPGVLVVQEGHAVVLERQGMISGIVGAGLHFLKPYERVNMVVYLATSVEHPFIEHVVTKDKVVIEKMELYIFYKVDPGDCSRSNGMYPFDVKVIIGKVWSPKGSEKEGKSADLGSGVKAVANTAIRDVVAHYDLVDVITATGEIRQALKNEIRTAIDRVTDSAMGIKIGAVDIGAIVFPEDAQKKLLDRWLIDWEAQINLIKADTDGQSLATHTLAETHASIAKAQAEREVTIAKALGEREKILTEADAKRIVEIANAEAHFHTISDMERVKRIADAEANYRITLADAEGKKIAKMAEGEGRRDFLMKEGEGKAFAARVEGFAKAESEVEKVRQFLIALAELPVSDETKSTLIQSLIRGDQYRDLARVTMSLGRRSGTATLGEGTTPGPDNAPESESKSE
ncbi:MAG: hypothetical protein HZB51_19345 [Chloroflexi bacterium]|nr:hypothetical protein [Chloroflexota bacterium]